MGLKRGGELQLYLQKMFKLSLKCKKHKKSTPIIIKKLHELLQNKLTCITSAQLKKKYMTSTPEVSPTSF